MWFLLVSLFCRIVACRFVLSCCLLLLLLLLLLSRTNMMILAWASLHGELVCWHDGVVCVVWLFGVSSFFCSLGVRLFLLFSFRKFVSLWLCCVLLSLASCLLCCSMCRAVAMVDAATSLLLQLLFSNWCFLTPLLL